MQSHAIQVTETGAPDVMKLVEIPIPLPGHGELLIRHTCIGINFIDTYFRAGLYPAPTNPFTPGNEGVGIVEAVGHDVHGFAVGDRVAYTLNLGAYATHRTIPAERAIKLPYGIAEETIAAGLLKGLTAHYLCRKTYDLKAGDWCVIHSAAGGVGQILTQWAKKLGAHVIATVGSEAKMEIARQNGADYVLLLKTGWEVEAKALSGGQGAHVVYDGVGKDTFPASLDALRPRGMWVTFGNASGPVPAFEPLILSQKGSLFMTRPTLGHYIATRKELVENAKEFFERILDDSIKVPIGQKYHGLFDVIQAHEDLEGRKTTGCSIVVM